MVDKCSSHSKIMVFETHAFSAPSEMTSGCLNGTVNCMRSCGSSLMAVLEFGGSLIVSMSSSSLPTGYQRTPQI